jgi:hypothetical protein
MMRLLAIFYCCLSSVALVAQDLDTLALPFFDDFASAKNGKPNPAFWQQSSVLVNDQYVPNQRTIGVATFDILDNNGKVYSRAGAGTFAADTLSSHAFAISPADNNIYLSFDFMPAGIGDMPEHGDSLLLYFFDPHRQEWRLAWSAGTNATVASADSILLTQHHFLADIRHQDSLAWNGDFATAMVEVPVTLRDTGFRFRFINLASRTGIEIGGMLGNCDMWHIDLVHLNKDRTAGNTTIVDIAFQKPLVSFLKTYTAMPWRHLISSNIAQREQLLTDGYVNLPFYLRNLSPTPSSVQVDLQLSLLTGGTWQKNYDNVVGQNIYPDTVLRFEPHISLTDILAAPLPDADSVAVEEQVIFSRYTVDPVLRPLLTYNDTSRYVQFFYDYYAYDDGTAENGFGIFGENAQNAEIAVKFHTYQRDTLTGVMMYFNNTLDSGNLQPFWLNVWSNNGTPGNVLYSQQCRAQFTGLNQFVWYKFDRKIVVDGDFFVGIKQQNTTMLNIGMDANHPLPDKTFVRVGAQWEASQVDAVGSLMIRPSFAQCTWETVTHAPAARLQPVKVYPNPADNELHFSLPDNLQYNSLKINILDAIGRCVLRVPFAETVGISALQEGIYWVQVLDRHDILVAVQKIVIVH